MKLEELIWMMRYKWRLLEEEDHVRIYPDGKVQLIRFNAAPHLDKGYITPAGHEVIAEMTIEQLQKLRDEQEQE